MTVEILSAEDFTVEILSAELRLFYVQAKGLCRNLKCPVSTNSVSQRRGSVENSLSPIYKCPYGSPSLARSVSKPLKVPSLARSVPKPLKVHTVRTLISRRQ